MGDDDLGNDDDHYDDDGCDSSGVGGKMNGDDKQDGTCRDICR